MRTKARRCHRSELWIDEWMYDTNGKGEQHSRRNGGGCGEVLETKCRMIILEKETD